MATKPKKTKTVWERSEGLLDDLKALHTDAYHKGEYALADVLKRARQEIEGVSVRAVD